MRTNHEMRKYLPIYLRRWMVIFLSGYGLGVLFETSSGARWPTNRRLQRSRKFELACLVEQTEFELRCGLQAALPGTMAHRQKLSDAARD